MLNADDPRTIFSLRLLKDTVAAGTKPVVFWIGAGASRWLGYQSWKDVTLALRREFFRSLGGFDNAHAIELVNKEDFPAVFQMCRDRDSPRYYRFIADTFGPRPDTDLYKAFVDLFAKHHPLFALTTNVDRALESRIPMTTVVQRDDLTRCVELLQRRESFIVKLHGSVDAVQTTVFSSDDYRALIKDQRYLETLKYIFTGCSVVFLGYGLRDDYVVRLLNGNSDVMQLFGAGPHFVVTNENVGVASLHPISYVIKRHPDHRAALSVLDYVEQCARAPAVGALPADTQGEGEIPEIIGMVPEGKTAYFISDFLPPGTWQTSQDISATGPSGDIQATVGLGFTNDEVPFRQSTAVHDLIVGLVCFDFVYLPLNALPLVHNALGSDLFWELVQLDALRFVHSEAEPVVLFRPAAALGDISTITLQGKDSSKPEPLADRIRRFLKPTTGKEKEAEKLLGDLERKAAIFRRTEGVEFPSLVRSALLMPRVSSLLGISEAILPTQVPRWLRYGYLRLAHLVHTGLISATYGIQAAKLPFGGVQLTSAAFGVQPAELQADHVASYVSSGNFNSDLGSLVLRDMSLIRGILRFRNSQPGESFRREVAQTLLLQSGREFNASVNAGLSRSLPVAVLEEARNQMSALMTESARVTPVPAVWSDAMRSDTSTRYWRAKSRRLLLDICATRGVGKDDPCICGSGEKLRVCCLAPLR